MKYATKLPIMLIALLLLTTNTLTRNMLGAQQEAQKRILADSFGGYVMKKDFSETCDDYEQDEIEYTEAEFTEMYDSMKGRFAFLQEPLRAFMKNQDDTSGLESAGKSNLQYVAVNFIFMVVSFFMTFIFIIYFFCMGLCACLCCCCDDELEGDLADKPGDSEMKRRENARKRAKRARKIKQLKSKGCTACISITSIVLVIAITVLGVLWSVYIFNSIGGLKRTDCAASQFFSNVRYGVKNNDLTFVGLGGVKYLFETLKSDINALTTPNNIPDQQLDVKADKLLPALKTYYDEYKTKTVTSCTGTGTATPDIVSELTEKINKYIGMEFDILAENSKLVHGAAVTANEIAGAKGDEFKSSLDSFITQIADAETNVEKFQKDFLDTLDTDNNASIAKLVAWGIMLGTAGLMIFFLLLMACSLNAKCTGMTLCLEAILAILKMFFAFIINAIALATIAVGVITANFCVFSYDALNDKSLAADLFPSEVKNIFDICLYKDSSGNLLDLVDGSNLDQVTSLREMSEGFAINLDDMNITLTEPPSIKAFREEYIAKLRSYEVSDFLKSPADDPQVQVDAGNAIVSCTQDEWQDFATDCTKTPVSQVADAADANLATDYCLVPSKWGAFTGTDRYSTVACAADAIPILTKLKAGIDSHDALLDQMDASLIAADGPKDVAVAIYTGLTNAKVEFDDLQTKMKKSVDFIASTVENLPAMMNCKVIRQEMRNILGNACYKFGRNLAIQGIILCFIGPLMTIFAFCVCCTYMQSKVADDLDDLKKAHKDDKGRHQQQYQQPGPGGHRGHGHGQNVPNAGYY